VDNKYTPDLTIYKISEDISTQVTGDRLDTHQYILLAQTPQYFRIGKKEAGVESVPLNLCCFLHKI
jgi:hypothetical protein